MEKVSIMFSALTHDFKFMSWFWLIVTFPVGLWHIFYFPTKKQLKEKELVEISPKFYGIDDEYLVFSLLGIGLLIFLPIYIFITYVDPWSLSTFGIKFYPSLTVISVGYGIFQGLFALLKGVYPMAKSLSYAYDEQDIIRRIAKYQIFIALATFGIVVLFFFATAR